MIKIISGIYRSRNISTPQEGTEPTKNRVREALFSAISNEIRSSCCLDLFAGSGALGIESLSRGANICFFNDLSKDAVEIVKSNLNFLGILNCEVLNYGYVEAINKLNDKVFDIVFLDPPYAMKDSYQNAITLLINNKMLSNNPTFVLEYCDDICIDESLFKEIRKYKYGKTKIMICRGLK